MALEIVFDLVLPDPSHLTAQGGLFGAYNTKKLCLTAQRGHYGVFTNCYEKPTFSSDLVKYAVWFDIAHLDFLPLYGRASLSSLGLYFLHLILIFFT